MERRHELRDLLLMAGVVNDVEVDRERVSPKQALALSVLCGVEWVA